MAKEKEKALAVAQGNSPADMIRMAVNGKADLAQLEKLLGLQERYEANQARKLYTASFSVVQANITSVVKTKSNPQTHSKYADLNGIIASSKPIYTAEGFSIIFSEGKPAVENAIRICADVLHRAGHKESYYYDVPLDGVGLKGNANMTKIHGKASSTSYGRRYLMCMIWNIPTGDDDDGTAAGKPAVDMPTAKASPIASGKPETGQGGTQAPKGEDIAETTEMNRRAAQIVDIFEACENMLELEEQAAGVREEINTKMSLGYKTFLKETYTSAKKRIEQRAEEATK